MLQTVTSTSFMDETRSGHPRWVRVSHWVIAASVLTLGVTGFIILMAHPRLYWGDIGNDLTPALVELPFGRNHWHTTWDTPFPFFSGAGPPFSAARTYDILTEKSWGRSLHFLAAWLLVLSAGGYALTSLFTGHFRQDLVPRLTELTPPALFKSLSPRAHRNVCTQGLPTMRRAVQLLGADNKWISQDDGTPRKEYIGMTLLFRTLEFQCSPSPTCSSNMQLPQSSSPQFKLRKRRG